jgi:hypothetical protein
MSLFKQDGPDDFVGAGIQGAIEGAQIGKIVFLIIAGVCMVAFVVLKFLLPIIIRLLAFVLPILWRLLVQFCRWGYQAAASGIAALKARRAAKTTH